MAETTELVERHGRLMIDTEGAAGYIRPELEGQIVPVTEVRLYPGNARRGDDTTIRESLLHHGQYQTVLLQASTGYVIAGNNLLRNMLDLGWTHVAVQRLDVDDDRARRILLIDNASSDRADNDLSQLIQLIAELPDPAGSGYTLDHMDAFIAELEGLGGDGTLPDITDVIPVSPAGPPLPDRPTADPQPIPTPPPAAQPSRTELPDAGPPTTRPARAPSSTSAWVLTLPLHDRDEARRLIDHARDWMDDTTLDDPEIVLRALRTLAAIGDARHNPTATVSIVTLLMAAGRDPLRNL